MKIPKEIVGSHRIRDCDICLLFIEGYLPYEIKHLRNLTLTVRRIQQIVYDNRNFVKSNKDWEKTKQVGRVKKQIRKAKDSKKDIADLEELLRKILDGDKPLIDASHHIHITNFKEFVNDAYRGNGKEDAVELPDGEKDTSRLPS